MLVKSSGVKVNLSRIKLSEVVSKDWEKSFPEWKAFDEQQTLLKVPHKLFPRSSLDFKLRQNTILS
jgi:hypothetical protein